MKIKRWGLAVAIFSGLFLLSLSLTAAAEELMKPNHTSSYLDKVFSAIRVMYVSAAGDNSRIAYSTCSLKAEEGKKHWHNRLYLKTAGGKEMVVAEGADPVSSLAWSRDGKYLAFLTRSRTEQQACIWIYDAAKNSSRRLFTTTCGIVSCKWSPDGHRMAFIAEDMESRHDRNPSELIDVSRQFVTMRLYVISADTGENPGITALTPAEYSVTCASRNADFDWSPDSRRIAFAHQPRPDFQCTSKSRIAIIELASGTITPLPYTEHHSGIAPAFSPDGKRLAFATTLAPGDCAQEAYGEIVHYRRVAVINLTGDGAPAFLHNTPAESPELLGWQKDGRGVYVVDTCRTRGAQIYLLSLEPAGGAEQLSHFGGHINPFSISLNTSGTTFGLSYETVRDAPEACTCNASRNPLTLEPLSHLNPSSGAVQGQVDTVHWKSTDGREIEGLLITPPHYDRGQKYPLYVMIHGAPCAWVERHLCGCEEYGPQMYDPTTALSAILDWGFVIFQPNFRGSTGYGKEFQAANVGDWGGKDYQDIMTGVDDLIDKGIADKERMVIGGWSYGGTMTAFAAGQTDRFKGAIVGAGVTDLISMAGTCDIPELLKINLGGYFWEKPELYWQRSAIAHVTTIRTPVLILHGAEDFRVPVSQARQLYQALKLQKKPVTMLLIPGEEHAINNPDAILATIEAIHAWLGQIPGLIHENRRP